jgi:hypothetical protein
MKTKIVAYLQLTRLPNVITAAADGLTGYLLIGGSLGDCSAWAPIVAASASIYAGGVALNDVLDAPEDRVERPDRPIPSRRVSLRSAWIVSVCLLTLGIAFAALARSPRTVAVAASLVLTVILYNSFFKKTILGPEAMGTCRGLNLLLGMSAASLSGGRICWFTAAAFGLYVTGITWISQSEVSARDNRGIIAGSLIENLAFVGIFLTIMSSRDFPNTTGDRPIVPIVGLLALLIEAMWVNLHSGEAIREPTPEKVQAAVRAGVLSLVGIDFALAASVRGVAPALAVAFCWFLARIAARTMRVT